MNFFLRTHIISPLIHNDNYLSIISQSNFSSKPIVNFSESKHSSNITHLKTQSSNKFTVNIFGFIKVKTQKHFTTITIPQPQSPFSFTNNNSTNLKLRQIILPQRTNLKQGKKNGKKN